MAATKLRKYRGWTCYKQAGTKWKAYKVYSNYCTGHLFSTDGTLDQLKRQIRAAEDKRKA